MHCAAMCGIPTKVVARAHEAASQWEHTGKLLNEKARTQNREHVCIPLGLQSDVAALLREADAVDNDGGNDSANENANDTFTQRALHVMLKHIEAL